MTDQTRTALDRAATKLWLAADQAHRAGDRLAQLANQSPPPERPAFPPILTPSSS